MKLRELNLIKSKAELEALPQGKLLINTINAFSYNNAQKDEKFREALLRGDALIPDGASIVKAMKWLRAPGAPEERIAGWDLFSIEMERLKRFLASQASLCRDAEREVRDERLEGNPESRTRNPESKIPNRKRVFFMGSSEKVLGLIRERAAREHPELEVVTYSPPYKPTFSEEENRAIVEAINAADPDLLWIGMTAPKQEKWAWEHWDELNIHCHCGTIGAVFDFYAGTYQRAPQWWQDHSLEWCYRLLKEPRRMWRRYLIGNTEFLWHVMREFFGK